jgi:hypothetical protein
MHIDSKQVFKPLSRVIVRNLCAYFSHPLHYCREVDFDGICLDSKLGGRFDSLGNLTCLEKGLRWHTAVVQTIAAEEGSLDQADLGAEAGRSHRSDEATCTGTDHDEVIVALVRVLPPKRVNVCISLAVRFVK